MAKILDGAALAKEIRAEVAVGVAEIQEKHQVTPGLAAVLVLLLGNYQVGPKLPKQFSVDPVHRVFSGPGLLDNSVNLFATQMGDLAHTLAHHRLGSGVLGVIASVRNPDHLVAQTQSKDDLSCAG